MKRDRKRITLNTLLERGEVLREELEATWDSPPMKIAHYHDNHELKAAIERLPNVEKRYPGAIERLLVLPLSNEIISDIRNIATSDDGDYRPGHRVEHLLSWMRRDSDDFDRNYEVIFNVSRHLGYASSEMICMPGHTETMTCLLAGWSINSAVEHGWDLIKNAPEHSRREHQDAGFVGAIAALYGDQTALAIMASGATSKALGKTLRIVAKYWKIRIEDAIVMAIFDRQNSAYREMSAGQLGAALSYKIEQSRWNKDLNMVEVLSKMNVSGTVNVEDIPTIDRNDWEYAMHMAKILPNVPISLHHIVYERDYAFIQYVKLGVDMRHLGSYITELEKIDNTLDVSIAILACVIGFDAAIKERDCGDVPGLIEAAVSVGWFGSYRATIREHFRSMLGSIDIPEDVKTVIAEAPGIAVSDVIEDCELLANMSASVQPDYLNYTTDRSWNDVALELLGSYRKGISGKSPNPKKLFSQLRAAGWRPGAKMNKSAIELMIADPGFSGVLLKSEVITSRDPRAYVCGNYTDCCMDSSSAYITDYLESDCRFFIVSIRTGDGSWRIIAQSVLPPTVNGAVVLDNIEVAQHRDDIHAHIERAYMSYIRSLSSPVYIGNHNDLRMGGMPCDHGPVLAHDHLYSDYVPDNCIVVSGD